KAFLGITLNCARCHDHMYDPILQTEYYQFRAFFEPYDVRTDRVPGQNNTANDGVVRVYDAKADAATYLFVRGNEANPDKEHPLSPAVPRVLGGGELKFQLVSLAPAQYYPGLRSFVQHESLSNAHAEVDRAQGALAKAGATLTEARKVCAEFVAKKLAANRAGEATPAGTAGEEKPVINRPEENTEGTSIEKALIAAVQQGQLAAALAEQEMLAASAGLVHVKAQIAADNAAFASPPADNAKELARDAARAERVFKVEQARQNLARVERELAKMQADAGDEKLFKKVEEIEKKRAEATKVRDDAQLALGEASETYTRFADVYPATSTGRRTALARWIASKDNPLTARVAINHIWLRHFGGPLVPTVFDFGLNGKRPTHPALLDWLAVELMEQGWKMKAIHRLLVTSKAYRMQSSSADEANRARDPENMYLWRMNPRRMEAEVVRDSTLRVSDGLDPTMFGPDLEPDQGMSVPRRSIYFRSSKEKKVPFLAMFDSPNVTDCYRRSETVVPQQALAMVNSSLTLAEARRLAGAMARELGTQAGDESLSQFVAGAFERILCRPPSGEERAACLEFLERQSARLADSKALVAFASGGENPVKPAADPGQRARENLIHVLLNHNDFLTIR
ncbi:MAG TPA: DUF1553 domain-containing protein, partial [Pirellulales bacterium]|nr:DUF1553 domain-containing protein [Pirellulales bacterium]